MATTVKANPFQHLEDRFFPKVYLASSFEAGYCVRCGMKIYDSKYDKCTDCERTG